MSNHMTYGSAVLLAGLLVGIAVTGSPARAQTAPAAPAAADECLAKPNGPSPRGSHWFYRIDRANNRHCWYLRGIGSNAGQTETRPSRAAVTPTARPGTPTPADPPMLDTPVWPASPPAIAPPASAAPATTVDASPTQAADAVAAQTPAPPSRDPRVDAPNPSRDAKAAKRTAAAQAGDRPVLPVEEPTHMPALLGVGLALALIMFGSFGARLLFKYLRRARRRIGRAPSGSNWDAPSFHVDDAPGIVPGLRRRPDITRDPHDLAHPPTQPNRGAKTPPGLDAVGIIEANVRDLLVRLRSEPQAAPARPEDGRSRPRDGR
ncbi:MAG: hypothetical protein QOK01_1412 [Alphaproteobacteria bacterium]|nr:hypothetical protein [Alphaproteobacteria bacterium]